MKIIKPGQGKVENGSAYSPAWLDEWLRNQGKFVQLNCGCIDDVHLPTAITLITSKDIQILCPNDHGFQGIKKGLTFKEAMNLKGYDIPETTNEEPMF